MADEPLGTKQALIEAAGELFADGGLDGTSIRVIAEKAGANIAAINYHFGSKEKLYAEVLRFVFADSESTTAREILAKGMGLETLEGIGGAIEAIVQERFTSYFLSDQPPWCARLVMRALLDPTPALRAALESTMLPEHEALKTIFRSYRPSMTDEESALWTLSVFGQPAFYVVGRVAVLMALGRDEYDEVFVNAAAKHVTELTVAALKASDDAVS